MAENYTNAGNGQGMDMTALAAQAQGNFAQAQNDALNKVASISTVQNKDGKSYWMGVELSPEMALIATQLTSGIAPLFKDAINGGVYKHVSKAYNAIYKQATGVENKLGGHKAGLRGAGIVMGTVIGLQPIIGVVQSVKNKSAARREIRSNLENIIETNKDYENNEVIKTVMERTNKIMVAGFKEAAAQLPMVVSSGYFAIGNHKAMVKKENDKFEGKIIAEKMHSNPNSTRETLDREQEQYEELRKFAESKNIREDSPHFNHLLNKMHETGKHAHNLSEQNVNEHQVDEKTQNFINTGALLGNIFMQRAVSKENKAELNKPTAYHLIMNLQAAINNGEVSEGSNISSYIVDIFQQNEIDRGRSKIGESLLNKFQPLAETIGKEISERKLDVLALVNLVGEGKVLNKRRFIDEEHLENLIDIQKKTFGARETTPLDDMLADYQKPDAILKAVKENLKNLKGDEKALFASLFSDDVLERSGIDKKERMPLRERGYELTRNFVINKAMELSEKSPEELTKMGLSSTQIEGINNLNELLLQGKEKAAKELIA
ncbi:MAG: hypothetical protein ABL857_08965, partial [Rickettsiales bacterium]